MLDSVAPDSGMAIGVLDRSDDRHRRSAICGFNRRDRVLANGRQSKFPPRTAPFPVTRRCNSRGPPALPVAPLPVSVRPPAQAAIHPATRRAAHPTRMPAPAQGPCSAKLCSWRESGKGSPAPKCVSRDDDQKNRDSSFNAPGDPPATAGARPNSDSMARYVLSVLTARDTRTRLTQREFVISVESHTRAVRFRRRTG